VNQNYLPEGTLDDNTDNFQNDNIYLLPNDILEKNTFNDLELNYLFLTMFYNTNITQASFSDVMKTFQMITTLKIPKSFNSCARKLLNIFGEKQSYSKKRFCASCAIFVKIVQHQRNCSNQM
jgi:hypothetical protein